MIGKIPELEGSPEAKFFEDRGEKRGEKRGKALGEVLGELKTLQALYDKGWLRVEQFSEMAQPLQKKLETLEHKNGTHPNGFSGPKGPGFGYG